MLTTYLIAFSALLGVFAIEKFDFILRTALTYRLGPRSFLVLFGAMMPTIMDAVAPIAALVATYLVVLQKREGREFLILSAAGSGGRPRIEIAAAMACVALFSSLGVAGFLKPLASHVFRSEYEAALAGVVGRGAETGQFFDARDTVLHVWGDPSPVGRKMRVFSFDGDRLDQVFASNCADMRVEGGRLLVDACEARVFAFKKPESESGEPLPMTPHCRICTDPDGGIDVVRVKGAGSRREFDVNTLFPPEVSSRQDELTLPALLARRDTVFLSRSNGRKGTIIVQQAIVSALGVGLAFLAAAGTTARTRFLALPAAIALLLGCLVLAGSGAFAPADGSAVAAALATAALAALSLGGLVLSAVVTRPMLTAPRLVRS
ncbi:LptF/LptG family permease [Alsobacter soli]|nr:LptF/LptG family permease [Alsobacter soli]